MLIDIDIIKLLINLFYITHFIFNLRLFQD